MYYSDSYDPSRNSSSDNLKLLDIASVAPAEACGNDPLIQEAFDEGLRQLAEDIVEFHPGLAHVLLGMGSSSCDIVHGQN